MQQTIKNIAHILERELKIYRELLGISKNITDVILNGEIKKLDELLKLQQTIIMTLGKLENDRLKAMDGLWKEDLVMTEIIERAQEDIAKKLTQLLDDLLEVIDEQNRVNEINEKLIRTELEYVEFALGTMASKGPINIFDEKA
ncbi:MAG: flagellar protein FlgN [Clostridiales bacterium]|nr:flagellar protein FlgN [Clostridiales bacterium]